jgi:hypothetical protein
VSNGLLIPKFGLSRIDTIHKPRPDSRIYAQNPRPPQDKGGHFLRFLWHNFGTEVDLHPLMCFNYKFRHSFYYGDLPIRQKGES